MIMFTAGYMVVDVVSSHTGCVNLLIMASVSISLLHQKSLS